VISVAKRGIDFMGKRNIFFAISGALTVLAIAALLIKGLTFGIEFQGGTVMNLVNAGDVGVEEVRTALENAGVPDSANAVIQPTDDGGYIVRTAESETAAAQDAFASIMTELKLPEQDINVTTIGPGWGANVTNAALVALVISLVGVLAYVSIRFEYKMSLMAVLALFHDTLIVLGIYAIAGREVTPNTIAALLTILGYSLYDTIVVFHRIKENAAGLAKRSFMEMTNDSINQMLMRWVNTGLVQVIPVLGLLFFGGETLRDFAFAMAIGLISGAYSSIGLASPLYAVWKEREPRFQALKKKYEAQAAK
jgi:SecD/SecF fusion protein